MIKEQHAMVTKASIGVRELKANPSKYLRDVRDERATYDITIRGEVVARLVPAPVSVSVSQATVDEIIARHKALVKRMGEANSEPFSVVDLMREERRES
jgi:prevent-host-death family protein